MKARRAYILLALALLAYLLFQALPFIMMGGLAFAKTDYITWKWIGLGNILSVMGDGDWWRSILNGLIYSAMIVPATVSLAIFVTLAVVNEPRKAQHAVRFIFYLPTFAAGVIIVQLAKWVFNPKFGLLNWLLNTPDYAWLASKATGMIAISALLVYTTMGGSLVLILAAVYAIPKELYEQAAIDGAGWSRIRWRIIFPLILPTVMLSVLLQMIGTMQIWETIYFLTNGGPGGATASPVFWIWQTAFVMGNYGEAAAQSIVLMLVILGLALLKRRVEAFAQLNG